MPYQRRFRYVFQNYLHERLDCTQKEFAKKLTCQQGVTGPTLSKWIGGTVKWSEICLLEACKLLRLSNEETEELFILAGLPSPVAPESPQHQPTTTNQSSPSPSEAAYQAAVKDYLEKVSLNEQQVQSSLFLDQDEINVSTFTLDKIYIQLRLSGQKPWRDATELHRTSMGQSQVEDFQTNRLLAFKENGLKPHLVLLGAAGSGKTTILTHLIGTLAKATLTGNTQLAHQETGWAGEPLTPLLVRLRHYAHYCQPASGAKTPIARWSFFKFLPSYVKDTYDLDLDESFFRRLLASGRCLLALDGFDEVPDETQRTEMVQVIHQLAQDPEIGRNIILLSSRDAAYGAATQLGGNFQVLWVQPLDKWERAQQIEKWVEAIGPQASPPIKAEDILSYIPEYSPLAELAVTPMIVTALCVVYFYGHKLPERRAELYRRCVDIMLKEKHHADETGAKLAHWGGFSPEHKRNLLALLAFKLHLSGQDYTDKKEAAAWLEEGLRWVAKEERRAAAYKFLEAVTERGTLLQQKQVGRFSFGHQHLTFREFLAGFYWGILMEAEDRRELWPQLIPQDRWREPIRLAVGVAIRENPKDCKALLKELLGQADSAGATPAMQLAGYKLAAEGLLDLGESGRVEIDIELKERIINGLADRLFKANEITTSAGLLRVRGDAAQTLARLGDPRKEVVTLPPALTDWLTGSFWYGNGEDKQLIDGLQPFRAGLYPITNAQYQLFVADDGYKQEEYWVEAKEQGYWQDGQFKADLDYLGPELVDFYRLVPGFLDDAWRDRPYDFGPPYNLPNHPVVGISWYEAVAFCRWLTEEYGRQKGLIYRLPTEAEWERLARGKGGHEYFWEVGRSENRANAGHGTFLGTCAVGLFPQGASPDGVLDMVGNVWEWCSTVWVSDLWAGGIEEYKKLIGGADPQVIRGESFNSDPWEASGDLRNGTNPILRTNDCGFRVCVRRVSPTFDGDVHLPTRIVRMQRSNYLSHEKLVELINLDPKPPD